MLSFLKRNKLKIAAVVAAVMLLALPASAYRPPVPGEKDSNPPTPVPTPNPVENKPGNKPETPKSLRQERIEIRKGSSESEKISVGDVAFEMVLVDGGKYKMGCNDFVDEAPVHFETVLSFYIGQTEVTQDLWIAVMGDNPSNNKKGDCPVSNVTWNDCQEFISKLNQITGRQFRLPTEVEWEFAARGGTKGHGYKFAGGSSPGNYGWYADNSGGKSHPVGTKLPNELGLYDMCGNVFEWTSDPYSISYNAPRDGYPSGNDRVFRGGSSSTIELFSRSSYRNHDIPSKRLADVGLRLAMDAEIMKNVYEIHFDGSEVLISSEPLKK